MAIGSLLASLALAGLSQVSTLTQLYLAWIALGVAMACTLYEPAFAVIARSFTRQPRRAIAVLTLFGGFASTVFWPLGQAFIDAFGWRPTALIFGALNLALCMPLHLSVLPRVTASAAGPAQDSPHPPPRQPVHDAAFYWLAAALTANMLVFSASTVHLLAMLTAKGLTALQAAYFGALIGPMQVAGRLAEMTVGQRLPPSRVGMISLALLPTSLVLLVFAGTSTWSFVAFAVLFGAGNGVTTIVRGTIPLELYGRDRYGAVNGALAAPVLVAKAAGPLLAALAFAQTSNYDTVGLWLAVTAVSSLAFLTLALRRRPAH